MNRHDYEQYTQYAIEIDYTAEAMAEGKPAYVRSHFSGSLWETMQRAHEILNESNEGNREIYLIAIYEKASYEKMKTDYKSKGKNAVVYERALRFRACEQTNYVSKCEPEYRCRGIECLAYYPDSNDFIFFVG